MKWFGQILLGIYRTHISAHLWSCCRFQPTCSEYAQDCFSEHNIRTATWLVFLRLLKCHPFGSFGFDPAPRKTIPRGKA